MAILFYASAMSMRFQDLVSARPVVFDGGMGATVQNIDLDVERDYCGHENCTDILVTSRPDLVRQIHESFLAVGADVVETNTFGANRLVFAEFDEELVEQTEAINRLAASLAREACDRYSTPEHPRFVAGSMGPGTKLITLGNTDWSSMLASYREQARGLLSGGVDLFIIETCQDLLQVKCAINACVEALRRSARRRDDVPIMVSITIETTGTMLVGSDIAAAAQACAGIRFCRWG